MAQPRARHAASITGGVGSSMIVMWPGSNARSGFSEELGIGLIRLNSLCKVYEVVINEQKELMSISQYVASVAGVQVLRRNASVRLEGSRSCSGPTILLLQYLGSLEDKYDCSIVR